jgi:hypothetical protein
MSALAQVSRTKALAAAASLLVLALAVDTAMGPSDGTGSPAASPTHGAAVGSGVPVVLAGAPRDLDAAALQARYAPIKRAQPFRVRSFEPVRPPRHESGAPVTGYVPPPRPLVHHVDPEKVELRLTGFVGAGETRLAILEVPDGSGKGVLVKEGATLPGAVEIAAVGTDSIAVVDSGTRKVVPLGEPVTLPLVVQASLELLAPINRDAVPTSSGGGSAPALSTEDREAVLRRLRERRRRTLSGDEEKAPEAPAPTTEASPPRSGVDTHAPPAPPAATRRGPGAPTTTEPPPGETPPVTVGPPPPPPEPPPVEAPPAPEMTPPEVVPVPVPDTPDDTESPPAPQEGE